MAQRTSQLGLTTPTTRFECPNVQPPQHPASALRARLTTISCELRERSVCWSSPFAMMLSPSPRPPRLPFRVPRQTRQRPLRGAESHFPSTNASSLLKKPAEKDLQSPSPPTHTWARARVLRSREAPAHQDRRGRVAAPPPIELILAHDGSFWSDERYGPMSLRQSHHTRFATHRKRAPACLSLIGPPQSSPHLGPFSCTLRTGTRA